MFYLTTKVSPKVRQMTLEELLFGSEIKPIYTNPKGSNTRTYKVANIPIEYKIRLNTRAMIEELQKFRERYSHLKEIERHSLYRTFPLPKKSGGLRWINAPEGELMRALRDLKEILEGTCGALYHTSAFAYIKKRSTLDALKRHQANESKWYAKLDLSKFFDSTTLEFTMSMLSIIYPFSEIVEWKDGREALEWAIELGFLDGGLPQGTPLSPTLTNIIMIPIDFEFNALMRKKEINFVCTRYADDFTISSRKNFDVKDVEETLLGVMAQFKAPFKLNREKTRYGSVAGQNWNLGLMINANNEITVGHKRKREFKAMLTNYIMDTINGKPWNMGDVQTLEGLRSYYSSVEPQTIDEIINKIDAKFGVNVREMIKIQLHGS